VPEAVYPSRPQHFDRVFLRAMIERHAANTIGADGCLLLVAVVLQEDAQRYTGPVDFWNGQLMAALGVESEDTLARVRKRCVDAGWLSYTPGSRSRAARYSVILPERTPCEVPQDCGSSEPTSADLRDFTRSERGTSLPTLTLKTVPANTGRPEEEKSKKPAKQKIKSQPGNAAKNKKPGKPNPLFDAIEKVTNADRAIQGGYIGKVAAAFKNATSPVTPDEVFDFAANWRSAFRWANPDEHPLLTIGIVQKHMTEFRTWRRGHPLTTTGQSSYGFTDFGSLPPVELGRSEK
jgi:hypothetical protein